MWPGGGQKAVRVCLRPGGMHGDGDTFPCRMPMARKESAALPPHPLPPSLTYSPALIPALIPVLIPALIPALPCPALPAATAAAPPTGGPGLLNVNLPPPPARLFEETDPNLKFKWLVALSSTLDGILTQQQQRLQHPLLALPYSAATRFQTIMVYARLVKGTLPDHHGLCKVSHG